MYCIYIYIYIPASVYLIIFNFSFSILVSFLLRFELMIPHKTSRQQMTILAKPSLFFIKVFNRFIDY